MALVASSVPNMDIRGCYGHGRNLSLSSCKHFLSRFDALSMNRRSEVTSKRNSNNLSYSRAGFVPFEKRIAFTSSPSTKMVLNGYARQDNSRNKIYTRLDSCLVITPPNGKKPCAIIKFLGGAFVGAVPEVTYGHLMNLLASEGFLIISVPYNVTFDHAQAATEVYDRFIACMDMILTSGLPNANLNAGDLVQLPVFSVGHSNGALLQLLTGSYFSEKIPKANVIISYNNRPAAEAVPYFEQFGPMVNQLMPLVEANPVYTIARTASGDAWKALIDVSGAMIQDQETIASLTKFVDQLPSVMNQVTQGISEFKPTPSENRDFCKKSYNVLHTLLVKFSLDNIDETDLLEDILKPRMDSLGGTLEKVTLPGTHLTPCAQDLKWKVGDVYTPADAIAQGLKSISLNDTKVLARTIISWLKDLIQK